MSLQSIVAGADWREIFTGKARAKFEAILTGYLNSQPWFSSRKSFIKLATIRESFNLTLPDGNTAAFVFLQVEYVDASPELYMLPLAFVTGEEAGRKTRRRYCGINVV